MTSSCYIVTCRYIVQMAAGDAPWKSFTEAHTGRHVRFQLSVSKYMRAALQKVGQRIEPSAPDPRHTPPSLRHRLRRRSRHHARVHRFIARA